ncbi:hypothetical protein Bca4012_099281 [Brassica carinata]|uniref:BnaC06g12820D protein n=5 Tax=Brassica TaxID=3705 RepID=A0A078FFE0_BRANA|nr:PREDICTED: defensin-like protein 313 [Brassica oleracea var. oleracea]XP_013701679.1 defensin-like protein 313 [Brassica napus]KAF3522151.1 hypothetical protein F2Q69_00048572 [Brassica cretica]VDD61643.1 unnamed protein product [Brassica oleracea]KAH0873575.1 hypothetical protein HID58_070937 [Brassica napus]CAF2057904.1 unnamed protein product [Brassica napus]CDY11674.1 BnaC06g12820D [Brassica napus]
MESKKSSFSTLLLITFMIMFIISEPKSVDASVAPCNHPVGPYTESCFDDCVTGKYGYSYESAFCRRDSTGTCVICCCEIINE